jgi:hypothetical protein
MSRLVPSLLLPLAAGLLVAGLVIASPAPETCPADGEGAACDPEAQTDVRAVRFDDEEDEEDEEAPALTADDAFAIEAAVWDHLHEEMWWHHGVYRVAEIWDRHLVPIWIEAPEAVDADRYEVAVEFMAVASPPSDFPAPAQAGHPPRRVPRTAEQAVRERARVRGPSSWQLTFELAQTPDGYEVVGVTVTGRPGERRHPWRQVG